MNYYNDNDAKAAAWLRELIKAGLIPQGDVDERSISDVKGSELAKYTQCHFFAGIGGWAYALRLAGWPYDRPVWTGSCPCQPFSCAGKRKGTADDRHLWPQFARLIGECRPPSVFGEQVASRDGREWLAGVRADLERMGYAVGAADLCAASQGAPHIRQRLYWLAYAASDQATRHAREEEGARLPCGAKPDCCGASGGMGEPCVSGLQERVGNQGVQHETMGAHAGQATERRGDVGPWTRCRIIPMLDGKARRIEPESFPLVDGLPGRVGLLRGYGNAIVPQVAAEFIRAAYEVNTTRHRGETK